ncbi:unnamed protein product [Camellia sinensis]
MKREGGFVSGENLVSRLSGKTETRKQVIILTITPKQTPLISVAEKSRAFSSLINDTRDKDSSKVGRSNSLSSVVREASTAAKGLECSREATSPQLKDSVWEE